MTAPMTVSPVKMADAIRVLSMDAVHAAKSGHQGAPMGLADVATVLWTKFLRYDPARPDWADRDRFVLSAGHASMLIYSLLHLTGFKAVTMEQIRNFRQWGSITAGHPEYGHTPGVECTTGPLGQGIATAVGMAMAERSLNARYGDDLVDHRTWVIAGDGCLMEGVSQEAISLAGRLKLSRLTVLFDDNNTTIDGAATISETGDQMARFKAAGWLVKAVDGHDHGKIAAAMRWAIRQDRPTMIACKTLISKGAGPKEGDVHGHGYSLFDEEATLARKAMGWPLPPFEIPEDIAAAWLKAGRKGAGARRKWDARLKSSDRAAEFRRAMKGDLPAGAFEALDAHLARNLAEPVANATRVHSGSALAALTPAIPEMIGGSADLTGSNNTYVKGMLPLDAPDYAGTYVHYGVREHGMAAAMNGMALHGGVIPFSGTFMVFSDYSRAAIRLGALMGVRVIHVMTHDSIGLGEDGPTHQPVEHLAACRAIPGLYVFRPADANEVLHCYRAAMQLLNHPTAMVLSRQNVPTMDPAKIASTAGAEKGGYVVSDCSGTPKAISIGTGTELPLCVKAQETLAAEGIPVRVVSMPCFELFDEQSKEYRNQVLPPQVTLRLACEAGIRQGWDKYIGLDGVFVGMSTFGASAPADQLYKHFKITSEQIVLLIKNALAS